METERQKFEKWYAETILHQSGERLVKAMEELRVAHDGKGGYVHLYIVTASWNAWQESNRRTTGLTLDKAPCHCNFLSSCCGIFMEIQGGTLVCNECGMTIIDLLERLESQIIA